MDVSTDHAPAVTTAPLLRQGSSLDSNYRRAARRSHRQEPFIIGVAGGTASGKTTVCDMIMQRLQEQSVVLLSQDSFYRVLTPEEHAQAEAGDYDFDAPGAFDEPVILECLEALRNDEPYEVPIYDFATHSRSEETKPVAPADVVLIEGILVLHMPRIRDMLNMKIFVDTDDDVRLARRIQRDVAERGRDVAGVIHQYTRFVKPSFDQYVAPSRRHADVIIPWHGGKNGVAIDLIAQHIRHKLQQHDLRRIYPSLEIIPSNFQIRGMHTIIRDRNTSKADFVFYADRLLRLVVEAGLGHLPFAEKTVVTPTGHQYAGVEFAKRLCGVSIIRSGESMENALRACCLGIKIGKILVHRERFLSASTSAAAPRRPSRGDLAALDREGAASTPAAAAAAAASGRSANGALAGLGSGIRRASTSSDHGPSSRGFASGGASAAGTPTHVSSSDPVDGVRRAFGSAVSLESAAAGRGGRPEPADASEASSSPDRSPSCSASALGAAADAFGTDAPLADPGLQPKAAAPPPLAATAAAAAAVASSAAGGPGTPSPAAGGPLAVQQVDVVQRSAKSTLTISSSRFGRERRSSDEDELRSREIVYEKLPSDIAERYVLLMDPILATGGSACRCIEVLLERGVVQSRILFLTLIAAPDGVRNVCKRFPDIKLITSEIDEGVVDGLVVPGVGEFGNRYFCD